MKRLILIAIVSLFSTLTVWAQTGTTAPQSIASAGATPTQAASSAANSRHHRNKQHNHRHHSHRAARR